MDAEIDPETLADRLDEGDSPRILDIRDPGHFARGHIPGSENLPLATLTDEIERLDGSEHVVTVCPHGQASVQAARLIAAYEGFDGRVESLVGGLEAWDGPLQSGEVAEAEHSTDGPEAPF